MEESIRCFHEYLRRYALFPKETILKEIKLIAIVFMNEIFLENQSYYK